MAEELNIDATVSDIAADLGLGGSDEVQQDDHEEIVDDPVVTQDAAGGETIADDKTKPAAGAPAASAAASVARTAPKSWGKETHDLWSKLSPEAQAQIELREKQAEEGITKYSRDLRAYNDAIAPYQDLIKATGVDAPTAIKALMEAHKEMSNQDANARAAYFVRIAKHYGIDLAKLPTAATPADEPAGVREIRERQDRIDRDLAQRSQAEQKAQREKVANEVSSFADAKDDKGNLKHPYFDECHEDIVALINAGHALDQAYEKAVYANPVTRAKELARLQTESEASLRAKAKQEAEKARNASRANVNSRDTKRAPQASKAGNWEETLEATMKDIKSRTH